MSSRNRSGVKVESEIDWRKATNGSVVRHSNYPVLRRQSDVAYGSLLLILLGFFLNKSFSQVALCKEGLTHCHKLHTISAGRTKPRSSNIIASLADSFIQQNCF